MPPMKPRLPPKLARAVEDRASTAGQRTSAMLDLLGRRRALRVIWELRGDRRLTFRALQAACDGISPSLLNARLAELRGAGIVAPHDEGGYRLTRRGRDLFATLLGLFRWTERWAREYEVAATRCAEPRRKAIGRRRTAARSRK